MVLHATNRLGFVAHAFDRLVIEIDPVHRHLSWERRRIHSEAVILRSNLDFASGEILYGLIRATMAEFKFEGLSAQRLSQDLVSETNPKNRHPALDEIGVPIFGI